MDDLERLDAERAENTQMNWYAALALIVGSPLFVLVFTNHQWAAVALKIYTATAVVLGTLLLFLERASLRQRWLWVGMIPVILLHTLAMWGLVALNEAYPGMDRFPLTTYYALIPIMSLEGGILYVILERFRPHKKETSGRKSTHSDNGAHE